MKKFSTIIISLLSAFLMATAVTGCKDGDNPMTDEPTPPAQENKGDNEDDTFVPPKGPVKPLSAELQPTIYKGKRWTVKNVWIDQSKNSIKTYGILADTIVNGLDAMIVSQYLNEKWVNKDPAIVMREDKGQIYELIGMFNESTFKYDFWFAFLYNTDPKESAVFETISHNTTIISRGTITLMGQERRATKVWSGDSRFKNVPYDYWVEGIGSLFGQVPDNQPIQPTAPYTMCHPVYSQLLECYDGDEKIYDYREFSHDLYKPTEVFSAVDQNQ